MTCGSAATSCNKKLSRQRSALNALIEKRLVLLRQQLTEYEQRLHRLPAPKENELKTTLAELQQRLDAMVGKFQAYRDAPPERSARMLQELEADLKEFDSYYRCGGSTDLSFREHAASTH